MNGQLVLTEEEALELLAYLVACADTCRREPAIYGSTRLLKGAARLAGVVMERSNDEVRDLWQRIYYEIERKTNWYVYDFDQWDEFVDGLPALVARELRRRARSREEKEA